MDELTNLGFTVSHEELDEAISIILDLLGWGVDPEYLVTTGLSPAVILRAFTELNLRLPTNLDVPKETKGSIPADIQPDVKIQSSEDTAI